MLPLRAPSWLSGDQGAAVGLAGGGQGGGSAELGEAAGAGFQAGHGAPGEEGSSTNVTFWWRRSPGAHAAVEKLVMLQMRPRGLAQGC